MGYKVLFTQKANEEIEQIVSWYRNQSASIATDWYHSLLNALDTLEQAPNRCPVTRNFSTAGMQRRQLLFGKKRGQYRIIFRIVGRNVYILRICHTAQQS